jgi:hypothetical protein
MKGNKMKFLRNVLGRVVDFAKAAENKAMAVGAAMLTGVVSMGQSVHSHAASYVPEGVLTTMTTNVTDTFEDVQAWVWVIFPIIALGWFAFNQTRKGAGKFGAK